MSTVSEPNFTVAEVLTRDILRFTLKWTIENVKRFENYGQLVYSKGITMAELGREDYQHCRWYFGLNPCCRKGDQNNDMKHLCIYLAVDGLHGDFHHPTDPQIDDLEAEFTVSVITGKGPDPRVIKSFPVVQHTFFVAHNERDAGEISHNVLFGSEKEPGLVQDDCITILADILLYKDAQSARVCEPELPSSLQRLTKFAQRQAKWIESAQPKWSDFVLISSDGKEFLVNRVFLMAHSAVFAAMLTHDPKESQESRCILKGVDAESVEILLEYLHSCGTATEKISGDKAEKILAMADQYGMMDLRLLCEGELARTISPENAVHYLIMACQRDLTLLKEAALKVIPKNMGIVFKGKALEEAMHEPEVVQTIMEHCSKKMKLVNS